MYKEHDEDLKSLYEVNKYGANYVRWDKKPNQRLVDKYVEKYAINTNCHYSCLSCQIHQISKYQSTLEFKDEKLRKETGVGIQKWFPINCNYIPKGISGDVKSKFEQLIKAGIPEKRAKRILFASVDSATWAELMFGFDDDSKLLEDISKHWYLRWYQKHVMSCSATRMALRWGRRSGKSSISSIKIIDKAFNKKVFASRNSQGEESFRGPKIAVVCPFETQVSNIFAELEKFILTNSDLKDQVVMKGTKIYTQTPPKTMEFKNGTIIQGFVTGASNKEDGSGGGSLRGFSPDVIYLDEMDMIPEYIFANVIKPLLLTSPSTELIGSSTPIGKKSTFYKMCVEDPIYKEIYVPSTCLPHWDMQEEELKSDCTEESFKAEYLAEFITDSYGVFKSQYVHEARENYTYQETWDMNRAVMVEWWRTNYQESFNDFIICMGIDWNKKVGTEFSIVGWSPHTTNFYVLENHVLSPTAYSGESYKEEVKRLNFKWNPNFIYADEGYGNFLIEDLQVESTSLSSKSNRTAYENSIVNLQHTLKSINFSSNIELFNPGTGLYFQKYAKNFLVENTVQVFERHKIKFAENDKILIKQLGNYIQVKKLDNGKIVYGMENESIGDHRLDALMIALGGLVIEESVYSSKFTGSSAGYHRERESDASEDFQSAQDQVNNLTHFLKSQRTNMKYEGFVVKRGDGSVESEKSYWEQANQEEPASKSRTDIINPFKVEKGFFSSKGAAKFVETSSREDYEENRSKPISIPRSQKSSIRTTSFGR